MEHFQPQAHSSLTLQDFEARVHFQAHAMTDVSPGPQTDAAAIAEAEKCVGQKGE